MSIIKWKPGLVHGPDGPSRQIVEQCPWRSGLFITRDGVARRRYFNFASGKWEWDAEPREFVMNNETGEMGYFIKDMSFVRVEKAIALAWRHRAPESSPRVVCNGDATSRNVRWKEEESNEEDSMRQLPGPVPPPHWVLHSVLILWDGRSRRRTPGDFLPRGAKSLADPVPNIRQLVDWLVAS